MRTNSLRKALLSREISLGTWVQIGHPSVVEVFTDTGFDWIAIDAEHTDIDTSMIAALLRATGDTTCAMVRVKGNETIAIRQALDLGADGVIVPLVNNKTDAQLAVASAKYPPDGIRGFAFTRANRHGRGFDDYVKRANDEVAVIAMIETKQAVENLPDILSVNGIDGILIGPYDLSGSYGVSGDLDNPLLIDAENEILQTCLKAGKSAGIHLVQPTDESIHRAISNGFTFIALGMDTVFLREASDRVLAHARAIGSGDQNETSSKRPPGGVEL